MGRNKSRSGILRGMKIILLAVALATFPIGLFAAEPLPRVQLEPLLTGLENPLYISHHNTPRIYIVQQTGKVLIYENGQLRKKPFLDLSKKVNEDYECGLLSIAFHPDFAKNGYVYADYTAQVP